MARKTATIVIEDEGRDKGKRFFITEMSAMQAERFAVRAIKALIASNVDLGAISMATANSAELARVGFQGLASISNDEVYDLMDELMRCVQFCPDKTNPNIKRVLDQNAEDIEEVSTLFTLKREVFNLNFSFFISALTRK